MLVALNNGKRVFASQAKRKEQYLCPHCHSQVVPHLGTKVIHHFKHKPGATCAYKSESIEHLKAKEIVFKTLTARGLQAQVEAYVSTLSPFGNRIADILVTSPNGAKVAIELQKTNITENDIIKRSKAYADANINSLWIPFAPPKLSKELAGEKGYCHIEKLSATQLMQWLDKIHQGRAWIYDPSSQMFWKYELSQHLLYVEATDFGGGYFKRSKRWHDVSFYGPYKISDLKIKKANLKKIPANEYQLASLIRSE